MTKTDKAIEKDELDYKIIVDKTRHVFEEYQCEECGKKSHQKIDTRLKEENQYDPHKYKLLNSL